MNNGLASELEDEVRSPMSVSTLSGSRPSSSSNMSISAGSASTSTPAPSLYSYDSTRDRRNMLREIAGRVLNTTNDLYLLPADEGEHGRLDKQHLVSLLAIDGLYIAVDEVREALAFVPGIQRAVLDLGCGGGNWAMGMAQEFPHVQVVGVDLAPTTVRPPPPNCRLEFDDITLGLEHYYNSFDVVHARCIANGVRDFEGLIHEAAKCVRPGGVLLFIEGNLEMQNEQRVAQELAFGDGVLGKSWLARATFEAFNLMKARGSQVDAGSMLGIWMTTSPDLSNVQYREVWTPIGPWQRGVDAQETQRLQMIGTLMRQNMKEFVRSCQPMFVSTGYPPALIERFIEGTDKELDELKLHMSTKWHYAWARRLAPPHGGQAVPATTFTNTWSANLAEFDAHLI